MLEITALDFFTFYKISEVCLNNPTKFFRYFSRVSVPTLSRQSKHSRHHVQTHIRDYERISVIRIKVLFWLIRQMAGRSFGLFIPKRMFLFWSPTQRDRVRNPPVLIPVASLDLKPAITLIQNVFVCVGDFLSVRSIANRIVPTVGHALPYN